MESRAGAARARWILVGAICGLVATGPAPGLRAETEASAEIPPAQVLRLLEARLLDATRVRFDYEITSEGALTAQLEGEVVLRDGRRMELEASGPFGDSPAHVSLRSDGENLRGGPKARPFDITTPPALREAMVIGLTRMGLLHNLARLIASAPPDHANGGVMAWVTVSEVERGTPREVDGVPAVPLTFQITVDDVPTASATLWLAEETGLPVRRTQTVRFGDDEMRVVESYTEFEVVPPEPPEPAP